MKYIWKAWSNDGCFEDQSRREFPTKKEAYIDMRESALEKMEWNTEWEDVDESDTLGYQVHFSRNKIVHKSYSGTYTYEIVEVNEKVHLHEREWEVIDSFTPIPERDWEVCLIYGVGAMWMNNIDGYIVLIEESNRILKSNI